MRFLKKLLIGVYIFLGCFAVATLIIFIFTGNEPTTLVGCTFGVAGVESMLAAIIKARENHKSIKENNENNENGNNSGKS